MRSPVHKSRKPSRPVSLHQLFRVLADPTRLRLLHLLDGREICVCYFVEIFGISQPKVSRHLASLRRAGLVAARRDGKWMHYRLADQPNEAASRLLRGILGELRQRPEMRRDLERLSAACCAPGEYKLPGDAPAPVFIAGDAASLSRKP